MLFKKKKSKKEKSVEKPEQASGAVTTEGVEDTKASKKDISSIDLKTTLIMIVVALISIGCAFVFVGKAPPSFSVSDFELKDEESISADGDNREVLEKDISIKPEKDKVEVKKREGARRKGAKAESTRKKRGKKKSTKTKRNNVDVNNDEQAEDGDIVVPLESIVVNLGGVSSRRYMRVKVDLAVSTEEDQNLIKGKMAILRNAMISLLSQKTPEDLETEGSLLKLRIEIRNILNGLLRSSNIIKQVYFSDFIVQ